MSNLEKRICVVLILVLALGIYGIYNNRTQGLFSEIPQPGGTFTEGVVAENSGSIENEIKTLTHAPLVKFDNQGNIIPALAKSWEIKEDGRLYEFKLIDGFTSYQARETIKTQKNGLSQIEVATPDPQTLQMHLKQPFSPILADLTNPIFPVGFYQIKKRVPDEVILQAQTSPLGRPYIENIKIEVFTSTKALSDALVQKRIDAALVPYDGNGIYEKFQFTMPRQYVVFLNSTRDVFKSKTSRQNLKTDAALQDFNFELTTIDSRDFDAPAKEFVDNAAARGANIVLKRVDQKNLEKEILANRNFDALLLRVDFGRDPDTYSFWHSSQIEKGQNLSSFLSKKADRLLEDARLTHDPVERADLYRQLQKILDDEVPAINLSQEMLQYNVNKKIKGAVVEKGFTSADRFNNIKDWYIETKKVRK